MTGLRHKFRRDTFFGGRHSDRDFSKLGLKDEGHYRIDGEILKNELQKWNQHPRKPRVPAISSFQLQFTERMRSGTNVAGI